MKYELTDDTIEVNGVTLHRIRALKSFGDVEAGDLGGYVQSESNLSHEGDAWVNTNACVFGNAFVSGAARVGNARVFDTAQVLGNSWVSGNARVSGSAVINHSYVYEKSIVSGMAVIEESTVINSEVGGFAEVIDQVVKGCRVMNTADLVLV